MYILIFKSLVDIDHSSEVCMSLLQTKWMFTLYDTMVIIAVLCGVAQGSAVYPIYLCNVSHCLSLQYRNPPLCICYPALCTSLATLDCKC